MAISDVNTGVALDNAKKYIEVGFYKNDLGEIKKKGSDEHKAAVIGIFIYYYSRWYCWWFNERHIRTFIKYSYLIYGYFVICSCRNIL